MRHALGVLGIVAAGVLLAVSAAMNYRFGFSLGRTEFDGQIYGAASAAADCLKALVPFFFFAAIRNKMWSQAVASAVVWSVVTAYSFTSCLGHAASNRFEGASERQVEAQAYKDLRADMKRAEEQLGWVPQHRPAQTVQSDIDNARNQRAWGFTTGCTEVTGRQGRDFCQQYHGFNAELAAAVEAAVLEKRITEIQAKLGKTSGGTVMAEADPQAAVLAKITSLELDKVQMAMTIFIALLLEIGSGFGMYIAFSQWRVYDSYAPVVPRVTTPKAVAVVEETPVDVAPTSGLALAAGDPVLVIAAPAPAEEAPEHIPMAPTPTANDNKKAPLKKLLVPASDVQRYYAEWVENQPGSTVSATELFDDYCRWCSEKKREAMAQPKFYQELQELGIKKAKIGGRTRYLDITLKTASRTNENKRPAVPKVRAA